MALSRGLESASIAFFFAFIDASSQASPSHLSLSIGIGGVLINAVSFSATCRKSSCHAVPGIDICWVTEVNSPADRAASITCVATGGAIEFPIISPARTRQAGQR
jgi:hypothetical protein